MLTRRRTAFALSVFVGASNFFGIQGQCRKRDIKAIVEDIADTSKREVSKEQRSAVKFASKKNAWELIQWLETNLACDTL